MSVREPTAALISAYRFFEGWLFEPGSISLDDFGRMFLDGRGYYLHLASWWERREDPDVLLVAYEHMQADPDAAVHRVAEFLGFGGDEGKIAVGVEQSSFATMKANEPRYDDPMMRALSERVCDLLPGGDSSKVRTARSGRGESALSPGLLAELDEVWQLALGACCDLSSYADMLAGLPACARAWRPAAGGASWVLILAPPPSLAPGVPARCDQRATPQCRGSHTGARRRLWVLTVKSGRPQTWRGFPRRLRGLWAGSAGSG